MDEFHRAPARDHLGERAPTVGVEHRRGGDGESRPDPLAAGPDEVAGHLGEEVTLGRDHPQQFLFHPAQVVGHRGQQRER